MGLSRYSAVWRDRGWLSIGLNSNFGNWLLAGQPMRVRLPAMNKPAQNVMFADSSPGETSRGYRGYLSAGWDVRKGPCGGPIVVNGTNDTLSDRHNKGVNLVLADGHAKWYQVSQIVPNGRPARGDWCQCIADVNAAKLKWLVIWSCSTD